MSRNRLIDETSPYLLQHKDNPVHWWAWGPDALEEARQTGKPILLSVGYAGLPLVPWSLAHESFEDDDVAAVMNDLFVNGQGRPGRAPRHRCDLHVSPCIVSANMAAGPSPCFSRGAEAEPFWGGTYFHQSSPSSAGLGSYRSWSRSPRSTGINPTKAQQNADAIKGQSHAQARGLSSRSPCRSRIFSTRRNALVTVIDTTHGGLQGAPKISARRIFSRSFGRPGFATG